MGTLRFTVCGFGRTSGKTVTGTTVKTSDAYTSSTAASYVEDGSGDITLQFGDVLQVFHDEAAWIRFGDDVATVGDGFFLPASTFREYECDNPGKVSIIDEA